MFNIITPTYNRKHTLKRVYDSLINQTYKHFKWIIVDDGSTDNSEALIGEWTRNSKLDIAYYKLPVNQGKSNAVNFALDHCTEPYTIIVDSDDSFSFNTLADLESNWHSIKSSNHNIGAIWTLVYNEDGTIQGDHFPEDRWQVNFKERVLDLKKELKGDKWHCWKTHVLKEFPLYTNEHCHIQESHTWNAINKKYDFLCLNIAHLKAHYTEGSLMHSKKTRKELAMVYYYGSYYGLKDLPSADIIKYKYYRYLAFQYIKSLLFYSDGSFKLPRSKELMCLIVFKIVAPLRLIKQLI